MKVHHYPLINYLTNDKGYFVANRFKQELDIFGIQSWQYDTDHDGYDTYMEDRPDSELKDATVFRWNKCN